VLEGVIFDCDGVLVDSEPLSNRALSEALRKIGLDVSVEESMATFMGRSWADCVALVEERLGAPAPAGFADDYRRRRDRLFRERLRPVPGIERALSELPVECCVASSGEHERIRLALELTGLAARFDGRVFSATEVERGKPAPDLFLHAAARMGWEPARCAVVEDTVVGVKAALAAGMRAFGFAAHTDAEALGEAGAIVFVTMDELPRLLRDEL
jgi:HAD superfamily hydrolase (TIGR01509 family)